MALLFRLAVFSFLVLLPITSAAQTAGDLYFGVRGGAVILNDAELTDTTGTLQALGAELEMKTGFGVAGAIGYDWRSPPNYATEFRAEFEVSYRYNDADSVTFTRPRRASNWPERLASKPGQLLAPGIMSLSKESI